MSRRAMGTTVFGGMIAATVISLLMVPVLYATIQRASDRTRRRSPDPKDGA